MNPTSKLVDISYPAIRLESQSTYTLLAQEIGSFFLQGYFKTDLIFHMLKITESILKKAALEMGFFFSFIKP